VEERPWEPECENQRASTTAARAFLPRVLRLLPIHANCEKAIVVTLLEVAVHTTDGELETTQGKVRGVVSNYIQNRTEYFTKK
jgi:hypothetical protein